MFLDVKQKSFFHAHNFPLTKNFIVHYIICPSISQLIENHGEFKQTRNTRFFSLSLSNAMESIEEGETTEES